MHHKISNFQRCDPWIQQFRIRTMMKTQSDSVATLVIEAVWHGGVRKTKNARFSFFGRRHGTVRKYEKRFFRFCKQEMKTKRPFRFLPKKRKTEIVGISVNR